MTRMAAPVVVTSEPARHCRVPLGRMGKGETAIRRQILAFRQQLERAVVEAKGCINEAAAMVIASASVSLREAKRAERRRANAKEELSLDDDLALSDRIVRNYASAERAVCKLGLEVGKTKDPWDHIYRPGFAPEAFGDDDEAPDATNPAPDAADGGVEPAGGGE